MTERIVAGLIHHPFGDLAESRLAVEHLGPRGDAGEGENLARLRTEIAKLPEQLPQDRLPYPQPSVIIERLEVVDSHLIGIQLPHRVNREQPYYAVAVDAADGPARRACAGDERVVDVPAENGAAIVESGE